MPGCMAIVNNEPCPNDYTWNWERWATQAEIDLYHTTGDLPLNETTCRILIKACEDHKMSLDRMAYTHDSTCGAPPTCDCSVGEQVDLA